MPIADNHGGCFCELVKGWMVAGLNTVGGEMNLLI